MEFRYLRRRARKKAKTKDLGLVPVSVKNASVRRTESGAEREWARRPAPENKIQEWIMEKTEMAMENQEQQGNYQPKLPLKAKGRALRTTPVAGKPVNGRAGVSFERF